MQERLLLAAGTFATIAWLAPQASGQCNPGPQLPPPWLAPGVPGPYAPPVNAPGPALPLSPGGFCLDTSLVLESWQLFWEYHREELLDLRPRVRSGGPVTSIDDFFLGHGAAPALSSRFRPGDEELREVALPALLGALRGGGSPRLTAAAALSTARVAAELPGAPRAEVDASLRGLLSDANRHVAESALLSIGVLGLDASAVLLREVLADTPSGREALGGGEVSERERALAAYGLGLIGQRAEREDVRRFCAGTLFHALRDMDAAAQDLPVACVVAIGLVPLTADETPQALLSKEPPPPTSSRLAAARALAALYEDGDAPRLVRAHVPGALARQVEDLPGSAGAAGRRFALELLEPALAPFSRDPNEVARGAALALGLLSAAGAADLDRDVRELLAHTADEHSDALTRRFAAVSLARAAGRRSPGPDGLEGAEQARASLRRLLQHGRKSDRPFVVLALGLLERELQGAGKGADAAARVLRDRVAGARTVDEVAAACLAAGLSGDIRAADDVLERLDETRNEEVRARALVGLALLGDASAAERSRDLLDEAAYRPTLLREGAVARVLLGDSRMAPELVALLADSGNQVTQESLARALGLVGDARVLEPLAALVGDGSKSDFTRAYACAALGMAAERDDRPWQVRVVPGLNYTATTPTLKALLDAGHWNTLGVSPAGS
jgi:HEAT repeat protein